MNRLSVRRAALPILVPTLILGVAMAPAVRGNGTDSEASTARKSTETSFEASLDLFRLDSGATMGIPSADSGSTKQGDLSLPSSEMRRQSGGKAKRRLWRQPRSL